MRKTLTAHPDTSSAARTVCSCLFLLLALFLGGCSSQPKAAGVDARYNLSYIHDDLDKHRLDLFVPEKVKNYPMLVFVHGGGWHWGDRRAKIDVYGDIGRSWAQAGIGVAVISYRLGDDHPIAEQIGDVAAAVAWVYKNSGKYGADTSRFFLAGHSAGSHLIAMTAFDSSWLKRAGTSTKILSGIILWSGLYDVPDAIARAGSMARKNIWYPVFGKKRDVWTQMSPLTQLLATDDYKAPVLLVTAERDLDVISLQSETLGRELQQKGIQVTRVLIPDEGHFSEVFSADETDSVIRQSILRFTGVIPATDD